ncbi:unnamed protein product [Rhizophagus irregularis]|nr:unnamed protein product [Rhizophagus irregularis]CAB4423209.1 unnamed protein product [Rhizophagus irregularis]
MRNVRYGTVPFRRSRTPKVQFQNPDSISKVLLSGFRISGWNFEGFLDVWMEFRRFSAFRFPYVWMEFRRVSASRAVQNTEGMVPDSIFEGFSDIWMEFRRISASWAAFRRFSKEIGSELANPIGKSAPIWIPESRREVSSDLPSYRKIVRKLG